MALHNYWKTLKPTAHDLNIEKLKEQKKIDKEELEILGNCGAAPIKEQEVTQKVSTLKRQATSKSLRDDETEMGSVNQETNFVGNKQEMKMAMMINASNNRKNQWFENATDEDMIRCLNQGAIDPW